DSGNDDSGNDDSGNDDSGNDDSGNDEGNNEEPEADTESDYSLIISGSVSISGKSNGVQFQGVSGSGNYSVSCTTTSSSYACYVGVIDAGDTWSGDITVSTNKVVCSPSGGSQEYTSIDADQSLNIVLAKTSGNCP
ncbi:hypothetical protein Q4488_16615, partial [Amphritea sp. 1_MG-2023]|uniref:hypothetical protein n=1 Tax=Amphritea sp. 1_MG-2023 TaxID=3062670 RepID=UPI0026E40021